MAVIFAPGQQPIHVTDQETIKNLRRTGIIPDNYSLVKKDQSGATETLHINDPLEEGDQIVAIPKHTQG